MKLPGRAAGELFISRPRRHARRPAVPGWRPLERLSGPAAAPARRGAGSGVVGEAGRGVAPHQASPLATGRLSSAGARAGRRSERAVLVMDDDGRARRVTGGAARHGEPGNGQHIRKAGEEAAAGEVLVKAGVTLNPAHLAVAALAGHDDLLVRGKPEVKLLLTGSDVVAQATPVPGQVRDPLGPPIAAVWAIHEALDGGPERSGAA